MSIIPSSRPQQTAEATIAILAAQSVSSITETVLLGIRGYYGNTFGGPGNNIDVYDDALFVISPDTYAAFNFNTDPSKQYGADAAMIAPGKYPFYKGDHHIGTPRAYKALRPYPEGVGLPCTRHGVRSIAHDTNIHRGGGNVTGSAGCQTIPPVQYNEAMLETIYPLMSRYGQKTILYVLIENEQAAAEPSPSVEGPVANLAGSTPGNQTDDTPGAQPPSLRRGSTGDAVIALQNRLIALGYAIKADGDFGPATETAVKAVQTGHRLDADGIVGAATRAALQL